MSDREQVLLERGFILHQRPYRNTSQLLECVTARHGRVGLIARGSRGTGRKGQRALLQPFVSLRLSWTRRGDLGRLTQVEPEGAAFELSADALFAGYYVNELLLRLLVRGDPNDTVFSCYSDCLSSLAASHSVARVLRLFELRFLRALGYGLELDCDIESGEPLKPEGRYIYEAETGPKAVPDRVAEERAYWGKELIALRSEALDDDVSLAAAKRLLGSVLKEHLGDKPLKSRLVMKDILARGL
ncbi:MAG: DNA repair protein RecO [Gammaproteobacteria bacterium]|nr:DNA repair protein RecO [Gammaproteobacteria bacterium]